MEGDDFYLGYNWLLANWFAFSGRIQQEMQKVRDELHEELACWRPGHSEPDWKAYANRMNTICRADGFPVLFVATHRRASSARERQGVCCERSAIFPEITLAAVGQP